MGNSIQVMLVDDSEETRQSIKMLLKFAEGIEVIAEASDGTEALNRLNVVTPDVILMDINMPVMNGVDATERIAKQYPGISVIVLSIQNDVEYVRRCMRAGARDFLFKPVAMEVLVATIEEVYRQTRDLLQRNSVAEISDKMVQRSRVITFLSAKGGVGKTTLAVNTAVALAEQGKRVVLVDFDVQFGDASLMLNLTPHRTMTNLIQESNEIDPDVVERYLTIHDSGLHLLPAPQRPEEGEYLQPIQARLILQSLQKRFEYVLVDTAPVANDVFFAILETTDESLLVNTLNLAILKNNRMLLDLLFELGYESSRMKYLLNRSNSKNGLKVRDVERVLKGAVYWELDNDHSFVETALNEGTPFVLKDRQHRLSRQLYALTALIEEQGKRVPRRNPLRRLLAARR